MYCLDLTCLRPCTSPYGDTDHGMSGSDLSEDQAVPCLVFGTVCSSMNSRGEFQGGSPMLASDIGWNSSDLCVYIMVRIQSRCVWLSLNWTELCCSATSAGNRGGVAIRPGSFRLWLVEVFGLALAGLNSFLFHGQRTGNPV